MSWYDDGPREQSRYLTAQVCLNGHTSTDRLERSPESSENFCSSCGAATIRACPTCNTPIRGEYYVPGVVCVGFGYAPPGYCHNCGKAFPWTIAKIAAAKDFASELDGLDNQEKDLLKATIDDLAVDGAKTELAVTRFKKLMKKAGQAVGSGLYKVVVDVASEAAKKLLVEQ